jgi:hypothetical protein
VLESPRACAASCRVARQDVRQAAADHHDRTLTQPTHEWPLPRRRRWRRERLRDRQIVVQPNTSVGLLDVAAPGRTHPIGRVVVRIHAAVQPFDGGLRIRPGDHGLCLADVARDASQSRRIDLRTYIVEYQPQDSLRPDGPEQCSNEPTQRGAYQRHRTTSQVREQGRQVAHVAARHVGHRIRRILAAPATTEVETDHAIL